MNFGSRIEPVLTGKAPGYEDCHLAQQLIRESYTDDPPVRLQTQVSILNEIGKQLTSDCKRVSITELVFVCKFSGYPNTSSRWHIIQVVLSFSYNMILFYSRKVLEFNRFSLK